jgi:hypothetical protein
MAMMLRSMIAGRSLWLAVLVFLLTPVPRAAGQPAAPQLTPVPDRVPQALNYQLLINPSLEIYDPAYGQFAGVDCQVASGWHRFWYGGAEPYWMDTRVFASSHLGDGSGHVERIAGDTSQMILSTQPYTAGLWQQVGGLESGVGYGFHAAMLTIYQTSAQPPVHDTMIKDVGLDPTGGTDPLSPQVVWSDPGSLDQAWDITRSTAAYAQGTTVTVFIRVTSPLPSDGLPKLNQSFLDSAILAETAQVSATSPPVSDVENFQVRWDNATPSAGAEIRAYDLQWLDEGEGTWHEWLTWTTDLAATFSGQWGHHYRFRARAWQRYPNGAHLPSPYSTEGDTQTSVGLELTGRVLDPQERGVPGATLTIPEIGQTAVSGPDGRFGLLVAPPPEPVSLAVSHPGWLAPPAFYGLSGMLAETAALTFTLRPRDDAVANSDFEADLEDWLATPGAAVAVSGPVHSGHGAALLNQGTSHMQQATLSLTAAAGLSQTVMLTDAWAPVLSFWYLDEGTGEQGDFQVVLTVVNGMIAGAAGPPGRSGSTVSGTNTQTLSPPLPGDGRWHHFWAYVDRPRVAFSGTVTVGFRLWDQAVGEPLAIYLDDVSMGSTPGGPWGIYLPLVAR